MRPGWPPARVARRTSPTRTSAEVAPGRAFTNSHQRTAALPNFLHHYNHHQAHTALNGQPPNTRVDNLTGHYT